MHSIQQLKVTQVLVQTFVKYTLLNKIPMQNLNSHICTTGYVSREQESICANFMGDSTIQFGLRIAYMKEMCKPNTAAGYLEHGKHEVISQSTLTLYLNPSDVTLSP